MNLSLCPLLVIDSEATQRFTLLRFCPTPIALGSPQLLRLAAVPFHIFRFFGPLTGSGETYPLDVWFTGSGIPPAQRDVFRPWVIWSSRNEAVDLLRPALDGRAVFALFVSTDRTVIDACDERHGGQPRYYSCWTGTDDGTFALDAPSRIWSEFTGALGDVLRDIEAVPIFDGHDGAISLGDLHPLAADHVIATEGRLWETRTLPRDSVISPARISRNFAANQVSRFDDGEGEGAQAYDVAAMEAAELLAFRGLHNARLIARRATVSRETVEKELADTGIPAPWVRWLLAASEEAGHPPEKVPPQAFRSFAPPQAVLVCAAMSREIREAISELAVWTGAGDPVDEQSPERRYVDELLDAAMTGGRVVHLPSPESEAQKQIAESFVLGAWRESETISAIALLHATRFQVPVLKLPPISADTLSKFTAVNEVFASVSDDDQLYLAEEDASRLAASVAELSSALTSAIPESHMKFLKTLGEFHFAPPLIHTFSDFPFDMVRLGDDYLGYWADLSRTPLTPGAIPFINYAQTEMTTRLPTQADEFLIVTPFADDLFANVGLEQPSFVPKFKQRILRTRDDLFDALHDDRIRCLVYFGHGQWDPESHSSALVLQDHLFTTRDAQQVARIPPVLILVGCNTAAAGALVGPLHTILFMRGAQLIVGTSFAVPKLIGALFLQLAISNLLSPGVEFGDNQSYMYRDLAEVMGVVRRRLRFTSDISSLHELGRLTLDQAGAAVKRFVQLMAQHRQETPDDRYQFDLLRQVLTEFGVMKSAGESLADLGIVPYPLFFQTLGFPWTNRSTSWST